MGNGSMMRCMPLIVYGHKLSQDKLFEIMKQDSSLSHANDIIYYINGCYAIAIQYLLNHFDDGLGMKSDIAFKCAQDWIMAIANEQKHDNENEEKENTKSMGNLLGGDDYTRTDYAQLVFEWLLKCKEVDDYKKLEKATGHHTTSLKIAFQRSFYYLYHEVDFVTAISQTVMEGGDTDTNACIVGGMIGAMYGIKDLPREYVKIIRECVPAIPERDGQFQAKLYFDDKLIETLIENAPDDVDVKLYL